MPQLKQLGLLANWNWYRQTNAMEISEIPGSRENGESNGKQARAEIVWGCTQLLQGWSLDKERTPQHTSNKITDIYRPDIMWPWKSASFHIWRKRPKRNNNEIAEAERNRLKTSPEAPGHRRVTGCHAPGWPAQLPGAARTNFLSNLFLRSFVFQNFVFEKSRFSIFQFFYSILSILIPKVIKIPSCPMVSISRLHADPRPGPLCCMGIDWTTHSVFLAFAYRLT